ncbi:unnamed protein product, partial [Agarophyton chilense]
LLCALLLLLLLLPRAAAHGLLTDPPQRGILAGNKFAPHLEPVPGAPVDFYAHFPAGDKSTTPGAGKLSQERAASRNWTPFTPFDPSFVWRSGVCGDSKTGTQDHLKGGKYYFDAHIVRAYRQGGLLHMTNAITAHHNGFVEVHVCDVSKCPDAEISQPCFTRTNACIQLQRAAVPECDSAMSAHCAPIDRAHPGRWYLPCSTGARFDEYGRSDHMVWSLPSHLYCAHCVLHWYWVSANTCNPPGVKEYYDGPDAPRNWGSCRGQGGAVGGVARNQMACGGTVFPEEYYQCADIRIDMADGARSAPSPPSKSTPTTPTPADAQVLAESDDNASRPTVTPSPTSSSPAPTNADADADADDDDADDDADTSPFSHVAVIADGVVVSEILPGDDKAVDITKYRQVALEAVTAEKLGRVAFAVNGNTLWVETALPYFLFGNNGREPNYWDDPIVNEEFELVVSAAAAEIDVKITLIRTD